MADAYAVYGSPEESTQAFFARMESVRGPTTQAYLGRVDGRAVSGATLYLSHGIGGVGWVGTRPSAFGRGYGAALTWRVVDEGLRRGVPFLNLQASPMGAPVYRRMGFETPTEYRMYIRME
jgi:GNAT superfamily N-acetyltransferase